MAEKEPHQQEIDMDKPQILKTNAESSRIEAIPAQEREHSSDPEIGSKKCEICHRSRNVLIRCQIDKTKRWYLICTGKCWNDVSGGMVDGPGFPEYKYGGMWKNKHAGASAKIKGKAKIRNSKGEGERTEARKGKSEERRRDIMSDMVCDYQEGQTDFSGRDSDASQ